MFISGQKVVCINDRFHRSIHDWGDQFPACGRVYTVKNVKNCKEAVTELLGPGLLLDELKNPGDRLRFSDSRFKPYDEIEIGRATAESFEPDQVTWAPLPEPVEQPHLPAPVAASARKRFSPAWKKPGVPLGWKPEVNADSAACLHALAHATEPITFDYGYTLEPGQLLAELAILRSTRVHWPSLAFADALCACRLLGRVEEICFLNPDCPARFTGSWASRLQRFSANVLAHADAAGLMPPQPMGAGKQDPLQNSCKKTKAACDVAGEGGSNESPQQQTTTNQYHENSE